MSEKFTLKAQNALTAALNIAREMGHSYVGSEHLLLGIMSIKDCVAARLLAKSGVSEAEFRRQVENIAGVGTYGYITSKDMTPGCRRIIEGASAEYESRGHRYIGTEHILFSLICEKGCVAIKILDAMLVDISEIRNNLEIYFSSYPEPTSPPYKSGEYVGKDKKASKLLSLYGKNMTRLAAQGKFDPIIGRDADTLRVIQILSRRTKNNPCLVGEAGVGKTAIVEGIAQRIANGDIPEGLKDQEIYSIDIGSMIAGTKYRGEFEERFKGLISEVSKSNNVILFIDEIHTIVGAGAAEGALDAANIIKPIMARGEIKIIGATTLSEYRKHIERDAALERRFQPVYVVEPSEDEAIEIIKGILPKYEAHHKIKISEEAIIGAVRLSKRYISNRYLPDKAIDLIDESASRIRVSSSSSARESKNAEGRAYALDAAKRAALIDGDFARLSQIRGEENAVQSTAITIAQDTQSEYILKLDDIAMTLSIWTGIDISHILSTEKEKLYSLPERLNMRIIGQDEAIRRVSRALLRSRSGIADTSRPLASFLFAGPTGVGKTQLSKALAEQLFGSEDNIIRFDMSEYMEKHTSSKLIGSPPGYVGYDEGGQLTDRVRRKPYSILLFDEIEKAHRDIFNLLLQVLDEGILKDAHGMSVDLKNTVIIMTSNIGSNDIGTPALGFANSHSTDSQRNESIVRDKIKKHFSAEFLNRIDDIIVFNYLSDDSMRRISEKLLDESCANIGKNGISIQYTPEVVDLILQSNKNKGYGARELKRLVTALFEDSYIDCYYKNTVGVGDRLLATVNDNKIVFENI